MAQLVDWLALSGARTSTGTPVSTGTAWFYVIGGGSTLSTVYTDVNATIISVNPVVLDAGGRAKVYVKTPCRIVIQDATGANVTDADQADVHRAENVQVVNSAWTDLWLDGVLTKIGASAGGSNGMYQESGGAVPRTIHDKFSELSVSVKDYGAKGDNATIDTTAIQAANNRVEALGGGEVYFPPGTYLIDLTLQRGNVSGVRWRGAGAGASFIKNTSGVNTAIACTGPASRTFDSLTILGSGSSTGIGIDLGSSATVVLNQVAVNNHFTAVRSTGGNNISLISCAILALSGGAAARGIVLDGVSNVLLSGGICLGASPGYGIELVNATSNVVTIGTVLSSVFSNAPTGKLFNFINTGLNTIFTFSGGMPSGFRLTNNLSGSATVEGYKANILSGASLAPDLSQGNNITIAGTTTGIAYNILAPTPTPSTTDYGVYLTLTLWNNAGAAITAWNFDPAFRAHAASTINGDRSTYRFHWDPDSSIWREVALSITPA